MLDKLSSKKETSLQSDQACKPKWPAHKSAHAGLKGARSALSAVLYDGFKCLSTLFCCHTDDMGNFLGLISVLSHN